MNKQELLNKLAEVFSPDNVKEFYGGVVVKQGLMRYFVYDKGEQYRIKSFLPAWLRFLLMAVSFAAGYFSTKDPWLILVIVLGVFYGLYFLIIALLGKNRKEVYQKIVQVLDKPAKIGKL